MVGADNGMAGVVTRLGISQLVGQLIEVLLIFVVEAQVQLDLIVLLLLCLTEVGQCPINAGLPLGTDVGRQHDINIQRCHSLRCKVTR